MPSSDAILATLTVITLATLGGTAKVLVKLSVLEALFSAHAADPNLHHKP